MMRSAQDIETIESLRTELEQAKAALKETVEFKESARRNEERLQSENARLSSMVDSLADWVVYDCQGKYTVKEIINYHEAKCAQEAKQQASPIEGCTVTKEYGMTVIRGKVDQPKRHTDAELRENFTKLNRCDCGECEKCKQDRLAERHKCAKCGMFSWSRAFGNTTLVECKNCHALQGTHGTSVRELVKVSYKRKQDSKVAECIHYGDCPFYCECEVDEPWATCKHKRTTEAKETP